MLNIPPQLTHRGIIVHRLNLPCLRGFSWFFSAWESCGRAAKRWKHESRNFGLESHFHADVRVRIWPSGLDWLIFLQTRKSVWLVRLIDNIEGTVGISVTALLEVNFASLLGFEFVCKILQFSVYTRSRFACVRHGFCFSQCLRRNFDFGTRGAFSRGSKSYWTSKESLAGPCSQS